MKPTWAGNPDNVFCALIAFNLLIPIRLPVIIFLLYAIFAIFRRWRRGERMVQFSSWPAEAKILVAFFLWSVVSVGYDMFHGAWAEIDRRLYFILVPLLFAFRGRFLNRSTVHVTMLAFTAGCLASTLVNFARAIYRSLHYTDKGWLFDASVVGDQRGFFKAIVYGGNYFFHKDLSYLMHPTYLSVYLILACVFLVTLAKRRDIDIRLRSGYIAVLFWFCLHLLLLSGRAALLSAGALAVFGIVKYWTHFPKRLRIGMATIGPILACLILFNPRVSMLSDQNELFSNNPRWQIWKSGIEIISENPVFGVGLGNIKACLLTKYEAQGFAEGIGRKFNLHNQYLESWAAMGLPGLLILLALFYPVLQRSGDTLQTFYKIFLLILAINFVFESMLNVFSGIILTTFFICLFGFSRRSPG